MPKQHSTASEIREAHNELQIAASEFKRAIAKFGKVYNTETVGLDEWVENINDTLSELNDDIECTLDTE